MFSPFAFFQETTQITAGLTYGRWAACKTTGTNRINWSNDGITWTTATTPTITNRGIDFSPELGLYCSVGDNLATNNIMTSTNSVTWTQRTKPNTQGLVGVRWCSAWGIFLANSDKSIFSSTDGVTWNTAYTMLQGATMASDCYNPFYGDTHQGTVYATTMVPEYNATPVLSRMKIISTTDGINFTESFTSERWTDADGRAIKYNSAAKRWMIVSQYNSSKIQISSTLSSGWIAYTQSGPGLGAPGSSLLHGLSGDKNIFISPIWCGISTTTPVRYSSTGLNGSWSNSTFPSAIYELSSIAYSKELDLFVIARAGTSTTAFFTSTNGITWTSRTGVGNNSNITFGAGVRTNGYKEGAGIT